MQYVKRLSSRSKLLKKKMEGNRRDTNVISRQKKLDKRTTKVN